MSHLRQPKSWTAAGLLVALGWTAPGAPRQVTAQQVAPPVRLDVWVADAQGRPVPDLSPDHFTVTVDGGPRRVTSARFVYRGPGSEVAARAAGSTPAGTALFEPARTFLLVVDEASFPRGAEKSIAAVADRLLDRFGPADHVALVRIPAVTERLLVAFENDRAIVREGLGQVRGHAAVADIAPRAETAAPPPPAADPSADAGGDAAPARVVDDRRSLEGGRVDPPEPGDRREHPWQTLARVLAGLRGAPGPKTVIVVTAGTADADGAARGLPPAVEAEASAARAAVYALGVDASGQVVGWSEWDQICAATGGELVRVGRNVDQALDRIGVAVSGIYQLELEPAASDKDGRTHTVKVAVTRPKSVVRVGRRLAVRNDPAFASPSPAAAPRMAGASDLPETTPHSPAADAKRGARGTEHDPDLDALIAKSREYLTGFFREFRNVVAEEDYLQTNLSVRPPDLRRTKSDFLLVTSPDGRNLVPFRDVFEVDGRAVRDREERLKKLFLETPPASAFDGAARVQNEGARYNLVSTRNTVNVPTFPLTFLQEATVGSFDFRRAREETVEGVRAVRVDYEESGRPTVIRTPAGMDCVSVGSLWIDPLTGRILKTYLRATRVPGADEQAGLTMEATVTYRRSDRLSLWVPAEMRESYRLRGFQTEGRALYSNFRSFHVQTEQEIKVK